MGTDLRAISRELLEFHDFTDEVVVHVGAGGGQLIEEAAIARRVIAVDADAAALARLEVAVARRGWSGRFELRHADLRECDAHGDVVLFEFCLHEMPDPGAALDRAAALAPRVVVIDHAPGSPWSWLAAEEEKVAAAWAAVAERKPGRIRDCDAFQTFVEYSEIEQKLAVLGEPTLTRLAPYRSRRDLRISMPYRLAALP